MAEKHWLGGLCFEAIGESTVGHDLHFLGLIRRAGLDDPKLQPGEAPEEFAYRLLGNLVGSGTACDILGCLLIPVGQKSESWTPTMGEATAAHIVGLTDPLDKRKIQALILSLLIDFFQSGLAFSGTSTISSDQPEKADQQIVMGPGAN